MEADGKEIVNILNDSVVEPQAAVNNLILDYYKKFGRKRDLEQFFSLSTAQSEIRDPSSLFWQKMKSQTDSDSGEKKSDSSTELCRISIQCSIPETSTSRGDYHVIKSDSESPPIINEEERCNSRNSDNESVKSDDIQSQKSVDNTLDTSTNKPHSPTSSITSQRKLEWDSLADVGYANESDRKNSASSLSTLERLALHQQYSINDTKQNLNIGPPTAQSTPLDVEENKSKNKKGFSKKTTKIYKRDVDLVKLNVSNNEKMPQPINVNLTKHISFNVERDGGVTVENIMKSVSVSPEKASTQPEAIPQDKLDKEIQTTLNKNKEKSSSSSERKGKKQYPVLISLNTLKKRSRRKKVRKIQRKHTKQRLANKENIPLEKSGGQVSEAESFEYMPGHMYNLNQMKRTNEESRSVINNKSSQESSAGLTTDSSRTTRHSFTKDLEKSIDILKIALDNRFEDEKLKNKLVKEVVQRLIKSKYKDDESSTEFLSGLSFDSKKIDLFNSNRTSSTSDTNNTARKPKKSILRMDKFNSSVIASTSQSVPNLPTITNVENPIACYTKKLSDLSNTDSDLGKVRNASATGVDKTSSEELYKKYLNALRREHAYKKHLKDKELFMKQKLASSDVAFNITRQAETKAQRIKDLMNDLVRNNYDDGSGDASKLEGSHSNINLEKYNSIRKQRSHSVFTLSSGNSDNNKNKICSNNKTNPKSSYKKIDEHYCCCPFHKTHPKIGVVDSSVQVNMTSCKNDRISPDQIPNTSRESKTQEIVNDPSIKCKLHQNKAQIVNDPATGEIKYVCLCSDDSQIVPENFLIYKCSKLTNKCLKVCDTLSKVTNSASGQTSTNPTTPRQKSSFQSEDCEKKCLTIIDTVNQVSKSSQTNLNLPLNLQSRSSEQSIKTTSSEGSSTNSHNKKLDNIADKRYNTKQILIHEATRWIQTEISIDPKISDPSLSDINVVLNKDCVQLVSEQYKKVSRPNSESKMLKDLNDNLSLRSSRSRSDENYNIEERKSADSCYNNRVEEHVKVIEKEDKGIQMISDEVSNMQIQNKQQSSNNFTIPIQGTNMTLKVSLGSVADGATETTGNKFGSIITQVSKGIETVQNAVVDNFTSLREECSKEVQSDNPNIFDQFYQKSKTIYNYKNTDQDKLFAETQDKLNNKAPYNVNTCLIENQKSNTYPKIDHSHIQKPLLRSNTDTDTIETAYHTTFPKFPKKNTKDVGNLVENQPDIALKPQIQSKPISTENIIQKTQTCHEKSLKAVDNGTKSKSSSDTDEKSSIKTSNSKADNSKRSSKDPILDMIQDITKRYSKKNVEKSKRKKCFKEIITVLNYLLDTEESADDRIKESSTSGSENNVPDQDSAEKNLPYKDSAEKNLPYKDSAEKNLPYKDSAVKNLPYKDSAENKLPEKGQCVPAKTLVDKGVQLSIKKSKSHKMRTESSDLPSSTEMPTTSTDSGTCKILNKIRRECERYHQKRCKCTEEKICETSSSTSANCYKCKHVHHCSCKSHKCRSHRKSTEKLGKKCVAYNLIIQTSDSLVSEEINNDINRAQLKNIIVKVPSKRKVQNMPFKEISSKIESNMPHFSPRTCNNYRSKSFPNDSEISSTDDLAKKAQARTVREYLEKNRPDFVERSSNRQHCLKVINETRANERAAKRQLLSMQLDRQQALNALTHEELEHFARELGNELRRKKVAPKFISEREMKKHSEKIYKSLPEVVRKKEETKKENIKKTNLLMANIFKKNLQKKTLQGAVNLSNYSTVIKI